MGSTSRIWSVTATVCTHLRCYLLSVGVNGKSGEKIEKIRSFCVFVKGFCVVLFVNGGICKAFIFLPFSIMLELNSVISC